LRKLNIYFVESILFPIFVV